MTDDAVRKKAEAWYGEPCGHLPPQSAGQLHGICIFCWRDRGGRAFTAGHAEGLAEGLKEAAGLVCWQCHDGKPLHNDVGMLWHETLSGGRYLCPSWAIHRELARSRGVAEGK